MPVRRKRRLTVRGGRGNAALVIDRVSVRAAQLVYVAVANKPVLYPLGYSRILYIGTTKNGVGRVAGSAAHRAEKMFSYRGVTEVRFHVLTCKGRQRVTKPWHRLERALLLRFKDLFGAPPHCNAQGKKMTRTEADKQYFTLSGLAGVLGRLERSAGAKN